MQQHHLFIPLAADRFDGLLDFRQRRHTGRNDERPSFAGHVLQQRQVHDYIESLRKAEESEEIAANLAKKRDQTDERRKAELAANLEERTAAMAIPTDDRDVRRKAILEVTAKEQETQKLSDEIAKYFVDIDRNERTSAAARAAAAQALAPLQKQYGLQACPVLAAPAKAAPKP